MDDGGSTQAIRRDHPKSSVVGGAGQRRRKLAVTLGKERRDAAVRAKRICRGEAGNNDMELGIDDETYAEETKEAVQTFKAACSDLSKGSSHRRLEALKRLRNILSSSAYPAHTAIDAGLIPILVSCLKFGSSEEQLLEAAWCLTNIAAGDVEQTRAMLPAVPLLIAHLGERSASPVAEQCAWAIGNVAGDIEEFREILLSQGALKPLGQLILSSKSSLARTVCWALSNLIKGPSPKAAIELIRQDGVLAALVGHLGNKCGPNSTYVDEELAAEAAWVVVYLSSFADTTLLLTSGVAGCLIKLLASSSNLVVLTPVLRSIGNIVAGDNLKTDAVVSAGQNITGGLTGALVRCLESSNRTLQKEGAWVISNIAAGSMQHKEMIFSTVVGPLVHLFASASFDVKKEVAYAIGNLCVAPKESETIPRRTILTHLLALVERGCVAEFVALVRLPDVEASKLGLQFLDLVMKGVPDKRGVKIVEIADGMDAIEMLQFHDNEELRGMANHLMDTYFGDDYGLEEEYGADALRDRFVEKM